MPIRPALVAGERTSPFALALAFSFSLFLAACGGGGGGGDGGSASAVATVPPPITAPEPDVPDVPDVPDEGESSFTPEAMRAIIASAQDWRACQRGETFSTEALSCSAQAFETEFSLNTDSPNTLVDRSSRASLVDTSDHGAAILELIDANDPRGVAQLDRTLFEIDDFSLTSYHTNLRYRQTRPGDIMNASRHFIFGRSGITGQDLNDHGHITTVTGNYGTAGPNDRHHSDLISRYGAEGAARYITISRRNLSNAVLSGKVRFFYGLNTGFTGRHPTSSGCRGVETACIGTPFLYNVNGRTIAGTSFSSAYAFHVYLLTWERMAEEATIAQVFSLGDLCTIDLGEEGADEDTGIGRLDLGCMARASAQGVQPPESTTVIADPPSQLNGPDDEAPIYDPNVPAETHNVPAATAGQAAHDSFIRSLFAPRLGSLKLPGNADARVRVELPGDSLSGHYDPSAGVEAAVSSAPPSSLATGQLHGPLSLTVDRQGAVGFEVQAHPRLTLGFDHRNSEDFFGGGGSGAFALDTTRRLRARVGFTPRDGLTLEAWTVRGEADGRGALLRHAEGSEHGMQLRFQHATKDGATKSQVAVRAWASRFAGGRLNITDHGTVSIDKGRTNGGLELGLRRGF